MYHNIETYLSFLPLLNSTISIQQLGTCSLYLLLNLTGFPQRICSFSVVQLFLGTLTGWTFVSATQSGGCDFGTINAEKVPEPLTAPNNLVSKR